MIFFNDRVIKNPSGRIFVLYKVPYKNWLNEKYLITHCVFPVIINYKYFIYQRIDRFQKNKLLLHMFFNNKLFHIFYDNKFCRFQIYFFNIFSIINAPTFLPCAAPASTPER